MDGHSRRVSAPPRDNTILTGGIIGGLELQSGIVGPLGRCRGFSPNG